MEKPDQANSRIRDMFVNKYARRQEIDELEALKEQGELIFTENDPIFYSTYPLDQVAVKLCQDSRITEPYFQERYKMYAIKVLGQHPQQASTQRSNMLKMMRRGHITFKRLMEFCCRVLGMPLKTLAFEFNHPTKTNTVDIVLTDLNNRTLDTSDPDED
jgi:hypothetical protein